MLAYEGAIFVPIAVSLICKKCSPLNVKLLCFSTNVSNCPVDGSSDSEDANEIPLPRFKKKSSWIPKPSKNTTLESFIDLVKNDVQTATSTNIPTHSNLTPAEKGALQELKERDDIVIKSADKGSAVVVMDKVDYLEEANRQLTDERFYKKLDSEPHGRIQH